ncbi:MAG: DinB family protein [Microcoleaceae cyanobacterium]
MNFVTLVSHFQQLSCYNALANQKLYEACNQLTDQERKQPRPAFFKSIHGTLNHILVGDRIWMARFQGETISSIGLDAILSEEFAELRGMREQEDAEIKHFFEQVSAGFLTQMLHYRNHAGNLHADPVEILITHFFNHQTHHRGQVHGLLSQTTVAPPSLDLHRILRPNSSLH